MTQEEIQEEIIKCKENPYYFATKYLIVTNHLGESVKFSTPLSEEEFNKMFNNLQNDKRRDIRRQ